MEKHLLAKAVLQDKPVAYHPDVARVCGSVKAGVFFGQLMYWSDKGKRSDGFIWKTAEDFEKETALTRREQEGARRQLKSREFIDEELKGVPATLHYRVRWDNFLAALNKHYVETSFDKSANPVSTKGENWILQNVETIPENTPESTQKNNNSNGGVTLAEVYRFYEGEIGMLSATISEMIGAAFDEFGGQTVVDAIQLAATSNVRKWAYVDGILKRWRANGKQLTKSEKKAVEKFDYIPVTLADGTTVMQKVAKR